MISDQVDTRHHHQGCNKRSDCGVHTDDERYGDAGEHAVCQGVA